MEYKLNEQELQDLMHRCWLKAKNFYNGYTNEYFYDYFEREKKQLSIHDIVGSLPIQDLPKCTRVEVIDQKGRSYVNWKPTNKVRLSMQDDGRTAKIFID